MVSQPIPVMTGDIGGTNARLSIILINDPSSQELNITEIDRISKHLIIPHLNRFFQNTFKNLKTHLIFRKLLFLELQQR